MKVWFVDAFTDAPFSGNPAAIIPVVDFPCDMQSIASEFNLSQTAFVKPLIGNRFHLRWFSPNDEAPICGHATLAAAHVLFQETLFETIYFQTLAGELVVSKQYPYVEMIFPQKKLKPSLDKEIVSKALHDSPIIDVYEDDLIYVAVLETPFEVESIVPDFKKITNLSKRAIAVTAPSLGNTVRGYPCDFVSRYFAPKVGIYEDPVCGSAHCRLAPLWAKHYDRTDLLAYQVSLRGGFIKLSVSFNSKKEPIVSFKAQAVTVGKAEIFLQNRFLKVT